MTGITAILCSLQPLACATASRQASLPEPHRESIEHVASDADGPRFTPADNISDARASETAMTSPAVTGPSRPAHPECDSCDFGPFVDKITIPIQRALTLWAGDGLPRNLAQARQELERTCDQTARAP